MNESINPGRRHLIIAGGGAMLATTLLPVIGVRADKSEENLAAPQVVSQADLTWFPVLPGETMAVHLPSGTVGGRFTVVESVSEPGAGTPPHVHEAADECFFIAEGSLRFSCNGEEFDAPTGSTVIIPRGAPHAWVNATQKRARAIVSFTPGGIEEMFPQMAAVFPDGIEALAARYETFLVR